MQPSLQQSLQEVLKQLQSEGIQVDENDFQYISPAPFEHINRLGKYAFDVNFERETNGLRQCHQKN